MRFSKGIAKRKHVVAPWSNQALRNPEQSEVDYRRRVILRSVIPFTRECRLVQDGPA
jgi:hypothetical protein